MHQKFFQKQEQRISWEISLTLILESEKPFSIIPDLLSIACLVIELKSNDLDYYRRNGKSWIIC